MFALQLIQPINSFLKLKMTISFLIVDGRRHQSLKYSEFKNGYQTSIITSYLSYHLVVHTWSHYQSYGHLPLPRLPTKNEDEETSTHFTPACCYAIASSRNMKICLFLRYFSTEIQSSLKFSFKISKILALHIALMTANAWISTLGGGHFLCQHIESAKKSARLQWTIAHLLENEKLKWMCWIHHVYIALTMHEFTKARKILRALSQYLLRCPDDELRGMMRAASVYRKRVMGLTLHAHSENRNLFDNFYRQRLPPKRNIQKDAK